MTGKARKRFLWTGVLLAALGLVPSSPSRAFGGLAALDAFHIGRYHLAGGDREKALEAFNDALRMNPQFVQAYVARGKLYAELGNYSSALADLNFALRLQPTHAEAFAYRGYALLSLGKPQEALPDLDMALRLDPSYARVHFLRGQALKVLGDEQLSASSIALAKRLDPTLEITQVVTAGADGSLDEGNLQLAGGQSPTRTPVMSEFAPVQSPDKKQEAERVGRLVPYQSQMAHVAIPHASRLPKTEERPPLFYPGYRSQLQGTKPTHPEVAAKPEHQDSPAESKIPDLVAEPEAAVATAAPAAEAMQPIPLAAEIIPLPETTSEKPEASESLAPPQPPSEVVKIPVHEENNDQKVVHAYPPVGPRIFTGPEVKVTDEPPAVELTASEILAGRAADALILPEKPSAAESEQRLADAIAAARKHVPVEPQVVIGDDATPLTVPSAGVDPQAQSAAEEAYRRGLTAEEQRDFTSAIAAYGEAIALNPTDPQALCRRGHLLTEQDRTAEALADFDAAIELAPGLANGYFGRAHVEYLTEQYADAVDNYTVALRLDDQHAQSLVERGHCLALLGKTAEAQADRRAALALDPRLARVGPNYNLPPRAPVSMAGATAFAGDEPQMLDVSEPGNPLPAAIDAASPETQPARESQQSAFRDLFAARRPTAGTANETPQELPEDASTQRVPTANELESATVMISDDGTLPTVTAEVTQSPADSNSAPQVLPADVLASTAEAPNADSRRRSRGELESRLAQLDADLSAAPGNAKLYVERATLAVELGRLESAIDDLNVALRLNPESAEALAVRALVHVQLERLPAALVDYDELVNIAPDDAKARAERGFLRMALGMVDEAIDDYTIALEMTPGESSILCRRAFAHALLGDAEKSEGDFAAAQVAAKSSQAQVEMLMFRSKAHEVFGRPREAVADLSHALKLDPQNAEALFERSRLYAERGAYEHSQADRRRALELDPTLR